MDNYEAPEFENVPLDELLGAEQTLTRLLEEDQKKLHEYMARVESQSARLDSCRRYMMRRVDELVKRLGSA